MRLYTAWQHVRGATGAPAGPGMTAGHRPAAPDPPGAALGPPGTAALKKSLMGWMRKAKEGTEKGQGKKGQLAGCRRRLWREEW